jgi:hypothetical protein
MFHLLMVLSGVLHVDYESLIPYLSESIRANLNDIRDIRTDTEQLRKIVDSIYEQFAYEQYKGKPNSKDTSNLICSAFNMRHLLFLIATISFVVALAVGMVATTWQFHSLSQNNTDPYTEISPSPIQVPLSDTHERAILKELFMATNGFRWIRSDNWLSNVSICKWFGVECTSDLAVYKISLPNNNLSGTYSSIPFLSQFSRLHIVDLSYNQLSGQLVDDNIVGSVTSLDLSHNNIGGTLPDFYDSPMQHLDLSHNQFLGTLPRFGPRTENLLLHHNTFSGEFTRLSQLHSLKVFNIAHNLISGTLILDKRHLDQLELLNISSTWFTKIQTDNNYSLNEEATCDASGIVFTCPLPTWMIVKCNAICL